MGPAAGACAGRPSRWIDPPGCRVSGSGGRAISSHPRDFGSQVVLDRVAYEAADWDSIVARHSDAEVYQTAAWLEFLRRTQRAEPVVATVRDRGRPVGYFVGAIVRRSGIRILGSPLRGWTTQCMGFLLEPGVDRRAAAMALLRFAFGDLQCLHVELADRGLTAEAMEGAGYRHEVGTTFKVDLDRPEQAILAGMQPKTRQKINKAVRGGLRAEEACDPAFADEFHSYLRATFARQGLAPTYGVDRVLGLIGAVHPSGNLLLLRIRSPEGTPVATGVSVGMGRTAVSWGLAFDRANDDLNPAQLLWWETIRRWRARGASTFDMGGAGDYKARYGGVPCPTVHFYQSRWPILGLARTGVRQLARARQIVGARGSGPAPDAISRRAPTGPGPAR